MHTYDDYKEFIKDKNKLLFLTGAGVSTLSGIKDFRSQDGLFNQKNQYPPEEILSVDFYNTKTKEFYEYYKTAFDLRKFEPSAIHKHIALLEQMGKQVSVVTQNVDGLHQKAGSSNVIEYHGTIYDNTCSDCHKKYSASAVFEAEGIPTCSECGGIIRPEIVLYGEIPQSPYKIMREFPRPDAMIVIGTSLLVSPANTFIFYCVEHWIPIVIINRDKTPFDDCATILINDDFRNIFKEGDI